MHVRRERHPCRQGLSARIWTKGRARTLEVHDVLAALHAERAQVLRRAPDDATVGNQAEAAPSSRPSWHGRGEL
eukprot:9301039-Pyramimonas_sp.AAC.1